MTSINSELSELKSLLTNQLRNSSSVKKQNSAVQQKGNNGSIWFNQDRLASVRVPTSESMLAVEKSDTDNDSTLSRVEEAITEHSIPVTKTFKNNSGETVLVCNSMESRDEVDSLIASKGEDIKARKATKKNLLLQ